LGSVGKKRDVEVRSLGEKKKADLGREGPSAFGGSWERKKKEFPTEGLQGRNWKGRKDLDGSKKGSTIKENV